MDQDLVSPREFTQLIGKMSVAILAVYSAPLHYRSLQALKHKALAASGYKVSPDAREDLLSSANDLTEWNGHTMTRAIPQSIETDASSSGWGAFCHGEATGGCCSSEEQSLHINLLEMLAILFVLKVFLKAREGVSVLILTDNMLVVDAKIFRAINLTWGPVQVDLFATRFSAQLKRFFCWRADPKAEAKDAFSQNWSMIRGFAHPPWWLIARVPMKVQLEEAMVILVALLWRTQPWFSFLLDCPMDKEIPRVVRTGANILHSFNQISRILSGLFTQEVMDRVGWSSLDTFCRYYFRPVRILYCQKTW